ncbi:MAG: class IV adenylate cyclase [Desulfovibrionaceae bacterium]|nr:class IV adenylate cyclase [Desulfovibrionaceae bacterium]
MAEELERKYLDVRRDDLRPRLAALGAKPAEAPHFEANVLYDLPDGALRARHELLRIRTREWADHADCRLTFKAPLPDMLVAGRPVKRREEIELGVDDARAMREILLRLGYRELARYEKVRESWTCGGAHVDMDELPFMHCVEIEASAPVLEKLERRLGLDTSPVSANSYHVLYLDWLAARNLPRQDSFVFDRAERARLRAELGLGTDDPS